MFFVFVVDLQVRRRNSRWVFPGKAGSASGLQRGRDGGIPGAASGLFPLFLDGRESPDPGVFRGFFFFTDARLSRPSRSWFGFFFWEKGAREFCTVHGAGERIQEDSENRDGGRVPGGFPGRKTLEKFPFSRLFFLFFFFSLAEAMSKTLQTFQGTGMGTG